MKFNNKMILSLLLIFIAAISLSCVSAEDVDADAVDTVVVEESTIDIASYDSNNVVIEDSSVAILDTTPQQVNISNNENASSIQAKIDAAPEGSNISFHANGNYTFGEDEVITVDKTLHFFGNNATFYIRNGFSVQASATTSIDGTSFTGFHFVIPSNITGNNAPWNGRAISISGGSDLTVLNSSFTNGNSGVYIRGSSGKITIANCNFTGVTNASTIGSSNEVGTKGINLMGGSGVTVSNNKFYGDLLDAISIASNSNKIQVLNNTISDAWYGIFYGGGLQNITTADNTFNKTKVYGIGLVKAAQTSYIYNNTFIFGNVSENLTTSAAIYIEQGNTAHGAATRIGDVYILDNKFEIANGTENSTKSRYAVEIYSDGGQLKTNGPVVIQNNTYDSEVTRFIFIDGNWNFDDGSMDIPPYTMDTQIVPEENDGTVFIGDSINMQLTGQDGTILPNQNVELVFYQDGVEVSRITVQTDSFGIASYINNLKAGSYVVVANFNGTTYNGGIYTPSNATFDVTSQEYTAIISGEDMTIISGVGNKFSVVLKDSNNRLLANQTVQFTINGVTYNRTTDENGVAGLNINLNMGEYTITAAYTDGSGNKVSNDYTLTAIQDEAKILSNITKITQKGQQFRAQLVNSEGKALAGQAVAFHINGVKYYKTTDENGMFYLNINLAPGQIYNMFMSYEGTLLYKGCTGGSQVDVAY